MNCVPLLLLLVNCSVSFSFRPERIVGIKKYDTRMVSGVTIGRPLPNTETEKSDLFSKPSSSMITSSANLLKNCLGAGVFSITSRLINISSDRVTIIKAVVIIFLMAIWATYNFWIVGETCQMTDSKTYGESWGKAVSENSAWVIQSVVTMAPIVSCLANTIALTDTLKAILSSTGIVPAAILSNRALIISLLGSSILFPLCRLQDLSALKSVSLFGLVGQFVSLIVLGIRLFDGSYKLGGVFYPHTIAATLSETMTKTTVIPSVDPMKWFIFSSLLSYCYVTHYNAPKFYVELENPSSKRFFQLAFMSFVTAGIVYMSSMLLGLSLFGSHSQPFLLNNLVTSDPLALLARSCFGASVLASYPLIFLSMRDNIQRRVSDLFKVEVGVSKVTAALLAGICGLAVFLKDISVVGSLSGAVFGSSMMFVFPAIMYIGALTKKAKETNTAVPVITIAVNKVLLVAGTILGLLGASNTVLSLLK